MAWRTRRSCATTSQRSPVATVGSSTIIDSTLFHSLPVEGREGYLRSIHRAAAPGARYYVLVFAKGAFPPDAETEPHEVDEAELRAAVSKYFEIAEMRSAKIHSHKPEFPDMPDGPMPFQTDEKGRAMMPAYLLRVHNAS